MNMVCCSTVFDMTPLCFSLLFPLPIPFPLPWYGCFDGQSSSFRFLVGHCPFVTVSVDAFGSQSSSFTSSYSCLLFLPLSLGSGSQPNSSLVSSSSIYRYSAGIGLLIPHALLQFLIILTIMECIHPLLSVRFFCNMGVAPCSLKYLMNVGCIPATPAALGRTI